MGIRSESSKGLPPEEPTGKGVDSPSSKIIGAGSIEKKNDNVYPPEFAEKNDASQENQPDMKQVDDVTRALIEHHVMLPHFSEYNALLEKEVNPDPEKDELIVVSVASGADLSNVYTSTHFTKAYFIDEHEVSATILEECRQGWKLPDPTEEYFSGKLYGNWGNQGHFTSGGKMESYLMQELRAMGADQNSVRILKDEKGRSTLVFKLPGSDKERQVIFVHADIQNVGSELDAELREHVDIVYQKAALDLLTKARTDFTARRPSYMDQVKSWVKTNGYIMSDDTASSEVQYDPYLQLMDQFVPTKGQPERIRYVQKNKDLSHKNGYGWRVEIYQKIGEALKAVREVLPEVDHERLQLILKHQLFPQEEVCALLEALKNAREGTGELTLEKRVRLAGLLIVLGPVVGLERDAYIVDKPKFIKWISDASSCDPVVFDTICKIMDSDPIPGHEIGHVHYTPTGPIPFDDLDIHTGIHTLIDAGAGEGRDAREINEKYPALNVIAIDANAWNIKVMLDEMQHEGFPFPNLTIRIGNVGDVLSGMSSGSVDRILFNSSFGGNLSEGMKKYVEKILSVLNDGGKIVIQSQIFSESGAIFQKAAEAMHLDIETSFKINKDHFPVLTVMKRADSH